MKALLVGFGSIAKKHARNLIDHPQIKSIQVFTHMDVSQIDFEGKECLTFIDSIDNLDCDFAIIANQTHKHLAVALKLAQQKIPLLIEKPVSHTLQGLAELQKIVTDNKVPVLVAYNLRFLAVFAKIQDILNEGLIGQKHFAKIEVGQYLPEWRPNTDYRECYSAHAEQGGGVALDLSHEIDYMCALFGKPQSWQVLKTKVSDLEINSDDLFEGLYQFKDGFVCNVHMDYLQRHKKRIIRIAGSEGELVADLMHSKLTLRGLTKEQDWTTPELFDVQASYQIELEHFLQVVAGKELPRISLQDGIATLQLLEDQSVSR